MSFFVLKDLQRHKQRIQIKILVLFSDGIYLNYQFHSFYLSKYIVDDANKKVTVLGVYFLVFQSRPSFK